MKVSFELIEQFLDHDSNPVFQTEVRIEGLPAGTGTGYSKKESQQNAAQMAIRKVKEPEFMSTIEEIKAQHSVTATEPENVSEENIPDNEISMVQLTTETAETETSQSKSPCDAPESPNRDLQ